jgi:hypothetical protein
VVSTDTRQVIFFLLALGIASYACLNDNARERLVTSSWQPVPAILMVVLSPLFLLMSVNAALHHRPTAFLILSTLLFGVAGTTQLVLVRRNSQAKRRKR